MKAEDSADASPRGWLGPRQLVAGLLALLAIVFIFQNTTRGRVRFLWIEVSAPGWLGLLAVFLAGFAVGWLVRRRRTSRV